MQSVKPVIPLAPWVGGKSRLAKTLISMINTIDHASYCEPFVGMGGVFLRRDQRPKSEVINDYSRDVSNFFRIIQRHRDAFMSEIQYTIASRVEFERWQSLPPDALTDIERAVRFFYLQKLAFGGKVIGQGYGVAKGYPSRFDISKITPLLDAVHQRLSSVVIESLPYADFIQRYDALDTLFYLDPPYYNSEGYYGKSLFKKDDFIILADMLASIKGKFILSINDHGAVRDIFSDFRQQPVGVQYSVMGGRQTQGKDYGELIIMPFSIAF